ncbi:adenine-specific methyltransferase EcoRI family protein [Paenibacillus sp. J5C_2022]|uniref:adenine-specific methyltransferase EcoRI family protein n=1 Tax=Paenibacillus sp. J5C2022 TaxID=2977129 RepID=UPI0021D245EA|nr:adenine-specific methyltransferase EcoRI family protein [Paenibacillus sp. J5C2022]MCU6712414.1 adenine-specific methyltransferase EcoRI family protein [Paenibacillus sp. J5C2022]
MANKSLTNAKRVKNDEFYTQFNDIQKEIESYLEYSPDVFRGKVVYCNCDDPFESNFFRYFVLNFNRIGLKRLITTSYKPSAIANTQIELFSDDETLTHSKDLPKITANRFIINAVHDIDGDGEFNLKDVALQLKANKDNEWAPLEGNGDFRSDESVELLKQSDIVVTNPPFSLFREYIKQLVRYDKEFLIIGNVNAITYKEVFPLIKENKVWLGATGNGSDMVFGVPKGASVAEKDREKAARLGYVGDYTRLGNSCWFTNLDHGRRHQPLPLMTMEDNLKFSRHKEIKGKDEYNKYDNYDAIEVPFTDAIPSDYDGAMGVPISFLDKYNPEQFIILGTSDNGLVDDELKKTPGLTQEFVDDYYKAGGTGAYKEGNPTAGYYANGVAKMAYKRIFIKHKRMV